MKLATVAGGLAALLGVATSTHANAAPAPDWCPSGDVTTVRNSQLTSPAALEEFKKAVADHAKWYADHGYTGDRFSWAWVIDFNPRTKTFAPSSDRVMTFHSMASSVPADKHDAAWKAYVAEYEATSTMLSETTLCMQH